MSKMSRYKFINNFLDKIKKMSIGYRITFLYALVFSLVLIAASIMIMINTVYYYRSISKKELTQTVNEIKNYIQTTDVVDLNEISNISSNKYIEIRVSTLDKREMFEMMVEPEMFPPPDMNFDGKHRNKRRFETETIKNQPYMSLEEIVIKDKKLYFIQVFRPSRHDMMLLKLVGVIFIGINIVAIFIAYLISKYISKKILSPIREMTNAADQITASDLTQRINVPLADDEIRTLAITFNDMIDRLQVSFEKQSRFISDASHELRTPISVIQGYANLMDRWGKTDPEILDESIKSIKSETEHMGSLVNQLLFMAREEENSKNLQKELVELGSVAKEVIKEFHVLDNINCKISLTNEQKVEVFADHDLIKQLMWIFIENSVKYSNSNNIEIEIKIKKDEKNAYMYFLDNGIGMVKEDITHIFDRFFRVDKSRNKDIEGNGLGLCIANWIIKEHNANIKVESVINEGSTFIVTMPLYKESKS